MENGLFSTWLRSQSDRMLSSAKSHRGIVHTTTIGEALEDILKGFLSAVVPDRAKLLSRPVIADVDGRQSKSFDLVFVNALDTPTLFEAYGTGGTGAIVPYDGVLAAIEVKSDLSKTRWEDLRTKCQSLRELAPADYDRGPRNPKTACFAFDSGSLPLHFFDYAIAWTAHNGTCPTLLCILGECCITRIKDKGPILYPAGGDSLQLFLSALMRWVGVPPQHRAALRLQDESVTIEPILFDLELLDFIKDSPTLTKQVRDSFAGRRSADISLAFAEARSKVGLKPS